MDFDAVYQFDWGLAQIEFDKRRQYGESRLIAVAPIGERLHVLIFTYRREVYRIISLRKANKREVKDYETRKRQRYHH